MSEQLYSPAYINTVQLINNFKQLETRGYDKLPLDSLVDIESYHKQTKLEVLADEDSGLISNLVG